MIPLLNTSLQGRNSNIFVVAEKVQVLSNILENSAQWLTAPQVAGKFWWDLIPEMDTFCESHWKWRCSALTSGIPASGSLDRHRFKVAVGQTGLEVFLDCCLKGASLALRAVKRFLPFTTAHLCESGFSIVATDQSLKLTECNTGGYCESEPFHHSTQTGSDRVWLRDNHQICSLSKIYCCDCYCSFNTIWRKTPGFVMSDFRLLKDLSSLFEDCKAIFSFSLSLIQENIILNF